MNDTKCEYQGWKITYNPKPIPDRRFDYDAVHDDYDGENQLCFSAGSVKEAIQEIEALNGHT